MTGRTTRRTGHRGELAARWFLRMKGLRLRHKNWTGGGGELDLVMSRRKEIVFVEVKTRSSALFGGAAAAVTREKQARIVRSAAAYLSRFDLWDAPCRFDVVLVEKTGRFPFWKVTHYVNAFQTDFGRRL
ncbi:MAG: YraN family protein [Acidobacteria bacterium]|nr:YraN family protein [Acidobacteriota bacterium]